MTSSRIKSPQVVFKMEFLEQIFNAIADPVFVKDAQHRWIFGNEAFAEILNLPLTSFLNKSDYDIFPKEMADAFWKQDDQVFASQVASENEEQILIDGQMHTILTKKTPVVTESGPILVGVIRDITERKNLEIKTEVLSERLRSAVSALHFGIWDWNYLTGTVVWDPSAITVFNMIPQTLHNQISDLEALIVPEDLFRFRSALKHAIANKSHLEFEALISNHEGTSRLMRTKALCFYSQSGQLLRVVGASWDVTNERDRERNLLDTAKMAAIGAMASGAAHEINNPLAVIKGRVYQLKKSLKQKQPEPEDLSVYIDSIEKMCARIENVISHLQNFAAQPTNQPVRTVRIQDLLESSLSLFRQRKGDQTIEATLVNPHPDLNIECRDRLMSDAIVNLTSFAHDQAALTAKPLVQWHIKEEDQFIVLTLTWSWDETTKMPPRLFELESPGLHIAIAKAVVLNHSGELQSQHRPLPCVILRLPKRCASARSARNTDGVS